MSRVTTFVAQSGPYASNFSKDFCRATVRGYIDLLIKSSQIIYRAIGKRVDSGLSNVVALSRIALSEVVRHW